MRILVNTLRLLPITGLVLAANSAAAQATDPTAHPVHFFPSAADELGRQGFARIINHSAQAGEVRILAFDDEGVRRGPLTLSIEANATAHLNSGDLENGNSAKGLTGSTGSGQGDWRLVLDSDLDIEVLSYSRTQDGFVAAMHDVAPADGTEHRVAFFNPGSNTDQRSLLRLVNLGDEAASATILGIDQDGATPGSGATATIPPGAARTYSAAELESGAAADLTGSIGDGTGKWRLDIESGQPLVAMSLLSNPTGHLTNLSTAPESGLGGRHSVPLFPSAADPLKRQGFVRVINRSDAAGEVVIEAFDDSQREYGELTLTIGARQTKHFNSGHLENGNPDGGLSGGTGAGEGDWRLTLASELDLLVLAYIRTEDGFVTAMHDLVPRLAQRHRVAFFNPASNADQRSLLRMVNADQAPVAVHIAGVDGNGAPGGEVRTTIPGGAARTFSAQQLEAGDSDLDGALGDGAGKWRLTVTADRPVVAMSLLSSPTGHLTNLSTAPTRGAGPPETAAEAFEAVVSPVVQAQCVNCHATGQEAGETRLTFVKGSDQFAGNLAAFENFLADEADGADRVLAKIQGELDHGGGVQVASDTAAYAGFEQFITLLAGKVILAGTVYAGSDTSTPLADAECEFAAIAEDRLGPAETLAAKSANGDGEFRMLAPSESDGFLICRPPGLPRVGLWTFARTGEAGTTLGEQEVSPRSTVAAMVLVMELLREPDLDMAARASALTESLAGNTDLDLLAEVGANLLVTLRQWNADARYLELLIDAFGNGRVDDGDLAPELAVALNAPLPDAKDTFAAATRIFADLPLLAHAKGIDDPAPPPPLAADPIDLASLAEDRRDAEFAANPSLYHMNAHWAYARGVDGTGETTGIVDSGLYAAHEEVVGKLHDETIYTVANVTDYHFYWRVREKDPATAYQRVSDDFYCHPPSSCKFYEYHHGTLMASLAMAARNGAGAQGVAPGADLYFRPFRQNVPFIGGGTTVGAIWYHPPDDESQTHLTSWHQIVRQVGDIAPVVSNAWLTGDSTFWVWVDPDPRSWPKASPFHEALTPRYVRYQRDRPATDKALLLWSAGNRPLAGGPLTDGAAVPGVSERQLRVLSDGERGLADLLLTAEEREGLSATEALRRAEQSLAALKRRWLAVVAVSDYEAGSNQAGRDRLQEHIDCAAAGPADGIDCAVDWSMSISARCGFASDWCLGAGSTWGGVFLDPERFPWPDSGHFFDGYRTSEASAAATGALSVAMQAYRDADGQLTVPTSTVLKRLKTTARRDLFDPTASHDPDQRNVLLREEDTIRSLIRYAGASDDDLRDLIDEARDEMNGTTRSGDAFLVVSRLAPAEDDHHDQIRAILDNAAGDPARHRDLLAQLIRQVEWIDEQLERLGRDKDTTTADDIRRIATISLVGHGLIDLKAATDPER